MLSTPGTGPWKRPGRPSRPAGRPRRGVVRLGGRAQPGRQLGGARRGGGDRRRKATDPRPYAMAPEDGPYRPVPVVGRRVGDVVGAGRPVGGEARLGEVLHVRQAEPDTRSGQQERAGLLVCGHHHPQGTPAISHTVVMMLTPPPRPTNSARSPGSSRSWTRSSCTPSVAPAMLPSSGTATTSRSRGTPVTPVQHRRADLLGHLADGPVLGVGHVPRGGGEHQQVHVVRARPGPEWSGPPAPRASRRTRPPAPPGARRSRWPVPASAPATAVRRPCGSVPASAGTSPRVPADATDVMPTPAHASHRDG
ncbi:hypothetical protein SRB17_44300 [Streptomyces sp. RB17]|nr:hypothetical protein [Streptomyces sp. RB17]